MSYTQLNQICSAHEILLLGVVHPKTDPHFKAFKQWIVAGKHGQMHYLENYPHLREYPASLEHDMPTVIVCAYPYGEKTTHRKSQQPATPLVAQYARRKDYHRYLRKIGTQIITEYLKSSYPATHHYHYRVVVDSAPILEKSIAGQTQSGFIGKNTLFIKPGHGSLVFLFEIYTNATIQVPATPEAKPSQTCGSCRRCQVHCPTGALDQAYTLDATKCIAYYTIEHRSLIPVQYWSYLGQYYFGCDICQLVCPHNRFARAAHGLKQVIPEQLDLEQLACMNHATYLTIFAGTPMTRAKRMGLRRNALIAMHVTNHPHLNKIQELIFQENHPLLVGTLKQRSEYDKLMSHTPNSPT